MFFTLKTYERRSVLKTYTIGSIFLNLLDSLVTNPESASFCGNARELESAHRRRIAVI